MSPRCSSASASRVVVMLTKYTAKPIDNTASVALARKMRLVREPRIFIYRNVKSASTAPPSSEMATWRDSRTSPSFHAFNVYLPGGTRPIW